MQTFPFSQKEIKLFAELNKAGMRYIIVGLASAAMQGAPIVTQDVDVWFENIGDEKIRTVIKKCGAVFVPSINDHPPALAGEGFDLIDIVVTVHGIKDFDAEYKKCIILRLADVNVRILPLEKVIQSKKYLNREKDKRVLPVLKTTLIAKKENGK